MNLPVLRLTAAVDALNVVALALASPRHGIAGAAGLLPALAGVVLAHAGRRRVARALCLLGLVPNTLGAIVTGKEEPRSRALSWYLGVGGAVLGVGYLRALRS